ncbi:MAG: hypothetical protein GPJ54_20405 [Candidatus Heimdallarchaeota archaeon]|nr:hypothetical protein [Candidatus Heimdallarchaeota archaeon]
MFQSIDLVRKNFSDSRLFSSDIFRKWLIANIILFWYSSVIPIYNTRTNSDFPNLHLIFFSYILLTLPILYILGKIEREFEITNYLVRIQTTLIVLSAITGFVIIFSTISFQWWPIQIIAIPGFTIGIIVMGIIYLILGIAQFDFLASLFISLFIAMIYLIILLGVTLLYFEHSTKIETVESNA